MPEGHVSHRNVGLWRRHLVGHRVDEAWACAPQAQAQGIPARLRGEIVSAAEARGKHHLLRFESGRVLHSHLRMVGVWRLLDRRPRDVPQLTLCLRVGGRYATLYRCQEIRLLEPGAPLPLGVRTLGPDLLDPDCDGGAALVQGARRVEPSRQVGEVVMDQRVVSGIGNVFKSEALFLAGSPEPEPADFINHSCQPNGRMSGATMVIAARDIEVGEPITYDYATSDGSDYDEFECLCGEPTCRGVVTGLDWTKPELQEKYAGWFSPYLARRIAALPSR